MTSRRPTSPLRCVTSRPLARIGSAQGATQPGYAAFVQGDLVSALRDMEEAGHNLPASSPVLRAISQQDRAEVLMAAGLTRQGLAALDEAARTLGQHRLNQRRGEAELTIARAALARDPGRALVAARAARGRFDRARTPALRLKAQALVHGAEVRLGRTRPSLVPGGDDLAAQLDTLELRWWAIDIRLDTALVVLRRGDHDEARRRLRALRVPRTAPLAVRLRDRDVRAALAERSGRPSAALGELRRGLADLHEWQSSFGSLDLQTMVTGHGRRLAVRGLRVASRSRSPRVLFEWSERARMLASRVQPVRVPHDDEVVADLAEPARLPARRRRRGRTGPARPSFVSASGSGRGGREDRGPPTTRCRSLICNIAWVVAPPWWHTSSPPDEWSRSWSRRRGRRRTTSARPRPLTLCSVGCSPASTWPLPTSRLVRTHGASRGDQPADATRRDPHGPPGRRAGRPSARAHPVGGTGDRSLDAAADQPRPTRHRRRVRDVVGRARRTPLRSGSAGFVAGPRVPQAESETNAAAKVWPGSQVLHGSEASAEAVSRLAGEVDVLHVSAHGRHSSENPLFSGFELADGPWFGYDIDQLERVPDGVLLSACEVGRSTLRGGEELIGMTAAWLHAGARCVVASAAAINDEVAHDVLVRVHEGLADGYRPAAALARALLDVDPEGPPAPLVVFG